MALVCDRYDTFQLYTKENIIVYTKGGDKSSASHLLPLLDLGTCSGHPASGTTLLVFP
jgi:hypothetical protein